MFSFRYRLLLIVLSLSAFGVGCASTRLEVPKDAAASPTAHSMPLLGGAESLREDFDPASADAESVADPHAHHQHAGPEPANVEPAAAPTAAPDPHSGHQHEDPATKSAPSKPNPAPRAMPKSDTDDHRGHGDSGDQTGHGNAAQHQEHDHE